jgi:hypothetical protein
MQIAEFKSCFMSLDGNIPDLPEVFTSGPYIVLGNSFDLFSPCPSHAFRVGHIFGTSGVADHLYLNLAWIPQNIGKLQSPPVPVISF